MKIMKLEKILIICLALMFISIIILSLCYTGVIETKRNWQCEIGRLYIHKVWCLKDDLTKDIWSEEDETCLESSVQYYLDKYN